MVRTDLFKNANLLLARHVSRRVPTSRSRSTKQNKEVAALEFPLSFSRTTSHPAAFDFVLELFDERWKAISETVMFGCICRPPSGSCKGSFFCCYVSVIYTIRS